MTVEYPARTGGAHRSVRKLVAVENNTVATCRRCDAHLFDCVDVGPRREKTAQQRGVIMMFYGTNFRSRSGAGELVHPPCLLDDQTKDRPRDSADEDHGASTAAVVGGGPNGDGAGGDAVRGPHAQVSGRDQSRDHDRLPVLNRHRICSRQKSGSHREEVDGAWRV